MDGVSRRSVLAGSVAVVAAGPVAAQVAAPPAEQPQVLNRALREAFGEGRPKPGKVMLKMPPIADSGNAVPITVVVDRSAGEQVKRIVVIAPGNPYPLGAEYRFGPRSAKPEISTRLRLARTQTVVAVAELTDGSLWSAAADLTVTLGACAEVFE
ncbi:MAG: sulfur oxidation protein SoxY [Proteobacteria bacterium]|nr:sulfur oxidation protein SoxY [Pseudomonadota bacterium]